VLSLLLLMVSMVVLVAVGSRVIGARGRVAPAAA